MKRLPLLAALVVVVSCGGNVVNEPDAPKRPPSCIGTAGAGNDCGADGKQDCCASVAITGGTFNRFNDPEYPATISSFRMDVYEVTIGRFRGFVDAWPASRPKPGDGAHPKVPGSGWKAEWDRLLPSTKEDFSREVSCADFPPDVKFSVWTASPGANERVPINCVAWIDAFAFCAWDGGRLPTEAEWLYNAVGGNEQRTYPWGAAPADPTRATLSHTATGVFTNVGSAPAGATRWGVMDIGGSRVEYTRDGWRESLMVPEIPKTCTDCIVMNYSTERFYGSRDLFFNTTPEYANLTGTMKDSGSNPADARTARLGIRCARD